MGHRNQAVVEVRQRTHRTERVQRLCFSVVVKVQAVVLAVFPAVAEPRLQQVRPGPGGTDEGAFAENVWSFSRMLAASRRDCPLISDFVPVTVIRSPLRTAAPSCPPRAGVRSTTLPF